MKRAKTKWDKPILKIYTYLFITGMLLCIGYCLLFLPLKWNIGKYYLHKEGKHAIAVVINKEVYLQDSQIGEEEEHLYKYSFSVDGKDYENSSGSLTYHIGDSIGIIYWPRYPGINMPVNELQ